jgi:hypothetical protein
VLGDAEGDTLGSHDGDVLGDTEGEKLGSHDGDVLGDTEGEKLGFDKGAEVMLHSSISADSKYRVNFLV